MLNAQERMSYCMRWLVAHPDAPIAERAAHALVVATAGEFDGDCTLGEVAMYAGCEPHEVLQGLMAAREQGEGESMPRTIYSEAEHNRALKAHQEAWEAMRSARRAFGAESLAYRAARERVREAVAEVRRAARRPRSR